MVAAFMLNWFVRVPKKRKSKEMMAQRSERVHAAEDEVVGYRGSGEHCIIYQIALAVDMMKEKWVRRKPAERGFGILMYGQVFPTCPMYRK
jgi:hypothetical protein